MKYVTAVAALVLSANAAACPASAALAERYGISFSGFDKPIPVTSEPSTAGGGPYLRVVIPSPVIVSDGFKHTVVMDTGTKKAWILRTGGFAGVYEWYGPVGVGEASMENCTLEPALASLKAEQALLFGDNPWRRRPIVNQAAGAHEARGSRRQTAAQ